MSELGADYFQFDNVKHQMLGERTGERFRLGDRVRVKLVRADLESNKIDFVLVRDEPKAAGRGGAKKAAAAPARDGAKAGAKRAAAPAKKGGKRR